MSKKEFTTSGIQRNKAQELTKISSVTQISSHIHPRHLSTMSHTIEAIPNNTSGTKQRNTLELPPIRGASTIPKNKYPERQTRPNALHFGSLIRDLPDTNTKTKVQKFIMGHAAGSVFSPTMRPIYTKVFHNKGRHGLLGGGGPSTTKGDVFKSGINFEGGNATAIATVAKGGISSKSPLRLSDLDLEHMSFMIGKRTVKLAPRFGQRPDSPNPFSDWNRANSNGRPKAY